jgi:hypothetical protein
MNAQGNKVINDRTGVSLRMSEIWIPKLESSAGNADGDEVRKSVVRKVSRRVKENGKCKLSLRCFGGTEMDGEAWVQDDSPAVEVSEKKVSLCSESFAVRPVNSSCCLLRISPLTGNLLYHITPCLLVLESVSCGTDHH